ncbi:MAG: ATP-binding protein [Dehalococcoidia bacterium]|nr:MAG: ATP-binding protein [Dehalococcoidia bacterium]
MSRFENSLEHLLAELERIDLQLRLQVFRMRERYGQPGSDEFRGLYISEEEIDALVASSAAREESDYPDLSDSPLAIRLRHLRDEIAEKKAASLAAGVSLRLCELADTFGLSDLELDALLVCILPEIDVKYEKLYAYLHDNVTRKRPSVHLLLQCLLASQKEMLRARDTFLPQAPLIAHRLIRLEDDPSAGTSSLLAKNLKAEDRIVNYLLGSDQIDTRLSRYAHLLIPSVTIEDMVLPEEIAAQLSHCASALLGGPGSVVYLQGSPGVGKKTAAEALCHACGLPLLMVDLANLLADDSPADARIALALREAKLQGTALCWDRFDLLLTDDAGLRASLETLIQGIRDFSGPVLTTGEAAWQPGDALKGKSFSRIEFDLPSYATRRRLWESYLNGHGPTASEADLEDVAGKFRFTPAQIRDAAATARNQAMCQGDEEISASDLHAACRVTSNHRLSTLARRIQPKAAWEDIVLPRDQRTQLREIANYVKYRHIVFADWNFEQKISLGKGLNILFAGPSGTGKTMASEIIANELGLDLYKIDLSTVISKYIGETEKNLDRIFTEARNSNSILFFDEADAVFGKRSEVRDSHDRYANIEVAYLLQKMEEYDGIVILATNLRKNLDEGFARRMHFSVEFSLPEEPDRLHIWQGIFPSEAPLAGSLDLNFMARQFKVTGGNIKNIALGAAFLAAGDGATIKMEHLIRATKREYQKIGRLCTDVDFAKYFDLVKG